MDLEAAVKEHKRTFDSQGMSDSFVALVDQFDKIVDSSFRAGWNARQEIKVAEQTPTNSRVMPCRSFMVQGDCSINKDWMCRNIPCMIELAAQS